MQRMAWLGWVLAGAAIAACGVTEPRIVDCGTDCPGAGGSGAGEGGGAAGDDGGADAGPGGVGGVSGVSGGVGGDGGSAGTPGGGSGGSGLGGSSGEGGASGGGGGGSDAGSPCGPCAPETPYCAGTSCVECSQDAHCAPGVCRQDVHRCGKCKDDADCGDPAASRCYGGECMPCMGSVSCEHLPETTVCEQARCVQCTEDDDAGCGFGEGGSRIVCDVLQRTCATAIRRSANLCEPCVSDKQCQSGQLCVMQRFDDPDDSPDEGAQDVGWFCFWREDATQDNAPDGDCADVRPFFDTITGAESVAGTEATVCGLAVTTCQGYKDYRTKPCDDLGDDESCGDSRFDGDAMCEMFSSSAFRCTTPCLSSDDCRPAVTCDTSQPVGRCDL